MSPDHARLREWNRQLDPRAIGPDDPRYVPLHDAGAGAVDAIRSCIELAYEPTVQLLSGPRGSGKTTELRRLCAELEASGHTARLVDISAYISQASEVDAVQFLIALALGVDEALPPLHADADASRWSLRFTSFLSRVNVSIAGIHIEADLQSELKSSRSFLEELRDRLAFHLGTLHDEVTAFIAERVHEHSAARPEGAGVVLVVDDLEKVRGTGEDDRAVQESVERLFVAHAERLRFSSLHVVYTVPSYLIFTDSGALPYDGAVRAVPVPHLYARPPERTRVERTWTELRRVVERRVDVASLVGDEQRLERVVAASGGHLRDLFRILRELISVVHRRDATLPATDEHIEEAITAIARDFGQIVREDVEFLRRVEDGDGRVDLAQAELGRLARLLDGHMLLNHQNGEGWYEVHPLARRALSSGGFGL